jgi:hypothetical protein
VVAPPVNLTLSFLSYFGITATDRPTSMQFANTTEIIKYCIIQDVIIVNFHVRISVTKGESVYSLACP